MMGSVVAEFSNSGQLLSPWDGYQGGADMPAGIAIDGSGNAWIGNVFGMAELSRSGTPISPPLGYAYLQIGVNLHHVAIDGSGDVWATSNNSYSVAELIGAATPIVTPLAYAVKTNSIASRP